MLEPITTKLAGVTYDDCQENIRQWGCADIGGFTVCREPGNSHDPNAIHVSLCGQDIMGYLPKQIAAKLAPMMDEGRTFLAEYVQRNEFPGRYDTLGLTVRIIETTPQSQDCKRL